MRHLLIALVIGTIGLVTFLSVRPTHQITDTPEAPSALIDTIDRQHVGICVWDHSGLRESPGKRGTYITPVYFGEQVELLGESQYLPAEKRTYIKIRLADGKEGWVNQYLFAEKAFLAVITKSTDIYRRPDFMTLKDEKFEEGEIVAVAEVRNDWIKVIGEKHHKSGWITASEAFSIHPNDILIARLYRDAMNKENAYQQEKALQEIAITYRQDFSQLTQLVQNTLQEVGLRTILPEDKLYITSSNVNLRALPRKDSGQVLRALDEGTICAVLDKGKREPIGNMDDYWYQVEYEGEKGWVYGYYTSKKQTP
ncbi:MAG: hypothetical protein D6730_04940 [Bacteroidetes bacterium]|nr:MAG: hypothetical protein D6730_04940 [Bacteroidota bacterium]